MVDFFKTEATMIFLRLTLIVLALGCFSYATAQGGDSKVTGGIITLYGKDPIGQSVCFKDNDFGSVFQQGQVRNRCSDLNFNSYLSNGFSVGIEGGREGLIVDLGTADDLKAKYGYLETVGGGQGFASISIADRTPMILKDYRSGTLQELQEARALFSVPTNSASVPVKLNHVYLLRITDRFDKDFELFSKVVVLSFITNESVTLRWQLIVPSTKEKIASL